MLCAELDDLTFGHLHRSQNSYDMGTNYGSKV